MKKLLCLTPFILAASVLFAQGDCNKDHPVYKADISERPSRVYALGSDPEFPFLRNLSTPQQVVAAMNSRENRKKYPRQMRELNNMLMEIGYANGTKDVKVADVSSYYVSPGTTGNMGNGHFKYNYSVIEGKARKAWKITSGDQCGISFFTACGNAFYALGGNSATTYTGNKPKCENVEVNINSDPKEVTVTETRDLKKKTYVYYKMGCPCKQCGPGWSVTGYNEGILSRPLLVKTEKTAVPETYKVTTNTTGNAVMCKGKTTEVTAGIVVEKENEYTGNMPDVRKEYIEVSKHEYKRLMREKEMMADVMQRPALEVCTTCP